MGGGYWTTSDWGSYSRTHTKGKTTDEIFTSRSLPKDLDPKGITVRESCDSAEHPLSTPIIIAFDVTGSMRDMPAHMVTTGLPTVIEQTLEHKPVTDPQFLMMAVGDAYCDSAPLQMSQFESDIRIAHQLKDFFLEGGGGGNEGESYNLAFYAAARKTKTDSLIKRGRKGVMFTIGDEPLLPTLEAKHIEKVFGDKVNGDIASTDLIAMAEKSFDLYHIFYTHGHNVASYEHNIRNWEKAMGKERIIVLKSRDDLPEIIASALRVHGGEPVASVANTFSSSKAVAVVDALKNLPTASRGGGRSPDLWRPPSCAA